MSKLKLLIHVCNSLLVWLALNVVCDRMLHVYQCCSIPQSSALAWGISWHKTIFLQLVQHAALFVICMARAYRCLGSAARAWFIACCFKYVFDLASESLWSSKEVEDWGWEIKIAVTMGCVILQCSCMLIEPCGMSFVVGGPLSSWMLDHGAQAGDEPAWCWERASCLGSLALKQYGIASQTVIIILLLAALFMTRTRTDMCSP